MVDIAKQIASIRHEQEEQKTEQLAGSLGEPYISLLGYPVAPDILRIVSQEDAEGHHVASFLKVGKKVNVATDLINQTELKTYLKALAKTKKLSFAIHLCSPSSLKYTLSLYDTFAQSDEK
ncbi:hypothetical protein HY065_01845, partial [Candidatus Berkelbacteria bacterium]|nr:hypothetical protein [Candidatus Berkelbacteria bacterium]